MRRSIAGQIKGINKLPIPPRIDSKSSQVGYCTLEGISIRPCMIGMIEGYPVLLDAEGGGFNSIQHPNDLGSFYRMISPFGSRQGQSSRFRFALAGKRVVAGALLHIHNPSSP